MALLTLNTPTPQTHHLKPKLWRPKRVLFTADALEQPFGQQMLARMRRQNLDVTELSGNRLPPLKGKDDRDTYRLAKGTLAVVNAPPSMLKLQPIPPSADWQFHLAKGCPAHCQYCYLAGSLSGPPITRVYANLPEVLSTLESYTQPNKLTTFEVSCYTDPLALEHLTGSLSECVRYFGTRENMQLRWVSKFDAVEPLLGLDTTAIPALASPSMLKGSAGASRAAPRPSTPGLLAYANWPRRATLWASSSRPSWLSRTGANSMAHSWIRLSKRSTFLAISRLSSSATASRRVLKRS